MLEDAEKVIEDVYRLMAESQRPLFITGAGISVESGLPTYRGIGGLYEGRLTDEGIPIEEALSGPMLREEPDLTWKYLWQIAEKCRGAKPNRAHEILAEIERERDKESVCVLTQNVDGLHVAAGSQNVIEIHGRASELYCVDCAERYEGEKMLFGGYGKPGKAPECPSCGGLVRPNVVLFGEMLPEEAMARLHGLMDAKIDLVVSMGTSSLFPYIAAPMEMARASGVPTVEINTEATEVSHLAEYRIEESCGAALEKVWKRG